jgi:Tfp pilus assembly protein PilZ
VAAHLRTDRGRSQCVVENVSLGGLFVRTDQLEEVGAEMFVDLVRPGWKKHLSLAVRVTSRVDALDGKVSKRMPGMGMQFLRVDDKQHDRLRQLLLELGAPEEALEITLPDEEAEEELRALNWENVQRAASSIEAAIENALAERPPPPEPGPAEDLATINERLTVQIRGLVMQLSDAQRQLTERDHEIERLKEELATARSALERAVRKS